MFVCHANSHGYWSSKQAQGQAQTAVGPKHNVSKETYVLTYIAFGLYPDLAIGMKL